MRRSHALARSTFGLVLVLACGRYDDVVERSYRRSAREFVADGGIVRAELAHAAYLPRGVEFRIELLNVSGAEIALESSGILLAYEGLEYPLDTASPSTMQSSATTAMASRRAELSMTAGEQRSLVLPFRLGRPMTDAGWIVLRGLRTGAGYAQPLWLEVPGAPSRASVEPGRSRRSRPR